ncbi:MAG: sporulation transcriptional regulator SpoIIID [Ruminococcus sp.]|nr:sporulation transcriptional regulator SpoIIID [Ruminococcus sp.]
MKISQEGRAVMLGRYIIENKTTVRAAADHFGISKSTVHKDVSERLRTEDPVLYARVKDILEINKQERHIRGGLATKRKYAELACRKRKYKYKSSTERCCFEFN